MTLVCITGHRNLCAQILTICTVLILVCFAAPVTSQGLGRFFSTPEERALLDELRNRSDLIDPDPEPVTQAAAPEPAVDQLSINGLVIRSGGADSAWVNGRPVFDGWTTREGVQVNTSASGRGGRVKITLPSGADTIDLKPGQRIDVESGVVVEGYDRKEDIDGPSAFESAVSDHDVNPEAADDGKNGG